MKNNINEIKRLKKLAGLNENIEFSNGSEDIYYLNDNESIHGKGTKEQILDYLWNNIEKLTGLTIITPEELERIKIDYKEETGKDYFIDKNIIDLTKK